MVSRVDCIRVSTRVAHRTQFKLPYDTCTGLNITRNLRLLHAGHFSTLYKSALAKPCPRLSIILSTSMGLLK